MRLDIFILGLTAATLLTISASAPAQSRATVESRREAADLLTLALSTRDSSTGLRNAARVAAGRLPDTSNAAAKLRALASGRTEEAKLRRAMTSVRDDLAFVRVRDAEMPVGFPPTAPVGEIVLKEYPRYRMVRTRANTGQMTEFWTLFAHIKSHDIAMTAPVEMNYDRDGERRDMAFLYGKPDLGSAGKRSLVEVVDSKPMKTVTIGIRGRRTDRAIAAARRALDKWMSTQQRYEIAGDMRVMGYNGPSVPSSRQFFEVEYPVRARRVRSRSL